MKKWWQSKRAREGLKLLVFLIIFWVAIFTLFGLPENIKNQNLYTSFEQVLDTELINPPVGAIMSDEPLPDAVAAALRNMVQIKIKYTHAGRRINSSAGTGYVFSGGIVLSARHILINRMIDMKQGQGIFYLPFYVNRNGIPLGEEYDYSFSIIRRSSRIAQVHSASIIALGEWNTLQDFMALKSANLIGYPDLVFADSFTEGEKIYVSGFAPVSSYVPQINGRDRGIISDLIEYTHVNYLHAKIENEILKRNGLSMMIRLKGNVNRGFSGGLAFNERVEVVGMTVVMYESFVYLISAQDIKEFLEKVRASM